MADIKTPDLLNEITSRATADILCIWDVDEAGSEKMKRMTLANFLDDMALTGTASVSDARAADTTLLELINDSGTGAAEDINTIDFKMRSATPDTQLAGRIGGFVDNASGFHGGLVFYTVLSGSATEAMRLDSTGRLGIGCTPSADLQVEAAEANVKIESTTGTNLVYQSFVNTAGNLHIGIENNSGGGLVTGSSAYSGIVNMAGNYSLQFGTNNTVRMSISSTGQIQFSAIDGTNEGAEVIWKGAGSYTDITQDLFQDQMRIYANSSSNKKIALSNSGSGDFDFEIDGASILTKATAYIRKNDDTGSLVLTSGTGRAEGGAIHLFGDSEASTPNIITAWTNNNERLHIDANGRIGFNATPGSYYFQINANTTNAILFHDSNAAQILNADTIALVINDDGVDRDFRIETDTREHAFFIRGSDGEIGINDSSPSYDLDVNGTFQAATGAWFPEKIVIPLDQPTSLENGCIWIA